MVVVWMKNEYIFKAVPLAVLIFFKIKETKIYYFFREDLGEPIFLYIILFGSFDVLNCG